MASSSNFTVQEPGRVQPIKDGGMGALKIAPQVRQVVAEWGKRVTTPLAARTANRLWKLRP